MSISPDDIASVRAATDIVALIGGYTEIKRAGRQWVARCPLHNERTPSLSVSAEKGVYYCFGCQRSGDVITFIREIENLDFIEAVEMLAQKAGIRLTYTNKRDQDTQNRKKALLDAVAKARDFYHERLLSSPDAGTARKYLRGLKYNGDVVKLYRIGWAPDAYISASHAQGVLAEHLNLDMANWHDSGLGTVSDNGVKRDFFRARLLFPITDHRGHTVAFGGRLIGDGYGPKYMNTSSSAVIYEKSRVLYGLHEHREEIVRKGEAVICEGYTDVISSAIAGVGNAVATCGTALTEHHVRLLKRFSANKLVLAFDADAAGSAAAERVYAWERTHEIEVFVADLPTGMDPDDLMRSNPDVLRFAVNEAKPLLQFRMERVMSHHHMTTVEDRAKTAAEASEIVGEHPDAMVRDRYLMQIADRCQVDIGLLRKTLASARDGKSSLKISHESIKMASKAKIAEITIEDEAIRLAIHKPDDIAGLLHGSLFQNPERRQIFEMLHKYDSLSDLETEESFPQSSLRLVHRLAVDPECPPVTDVLAGLVRLMVPHIMNELRRCALSTADLALRQEYLNSFIWVRTQSEQLLISDKSAEILDVLIPWLIQYKRSEVEQSEVETVGVETVDAHI